MMNTKWLTYLTERKPKELKGSRQRTLYSYYKQLTGNDKAFIYVCVTRGDRL